MLNKRASAAVWLFRSAIYQLPKTIRAPVARFRSWLPFVSKHDCPPGFIPDIVRSKVRCTYWAFTHVAIIANGQLKRSLILLGFLAISNSALADEAVKRLSEPVAVTDTHEIFGGTLPEGITPKSLTELIHAGDQYQDQEVLVETRIAKVCQKKGCFFVATEGAATARISFKDYGFFISTDAGGKDVLLLGTFARASISEEEAEHFAADLGETSTSNPEQFQYSIVASAVRIPKS